jgi:hypothetical protein
MRGAIEARSAKKSAREFTKARVHLSNGVPGGLREGECHCRGVQLASQLCQPRSARNSSGTWDMRCK